MELLLLCSLQIPDFLLHDKYSHPSSFTALYKKTVHEKHVELANIESGFKRCYGALLAHPTRVDTKESEEKNDSQHELTPKFYLQQATWLMDSQ